MAVYPLGVYDTYSHKQVRVYQYSHKYEHLLASFSRCKRPAYCATNPFHEIGSAKNNIKSWIVKSLPHIFPWLPLQEGHLGISCNFCVVSLVLLQSFSCELYDVGYMLLQHFRQAILHEKFRKVSIIGVRPAATTLRTSSIIRLFRISDSARDCDSAVNDCFVIGNRFIRCKFRTR